MNAMMTDVKAETSEQEVDRSARYSLVDNQKWGWTSHKKKKKSGKYKQQEQINISTEGLFRGQPNKITD